MTILPHIVSNMPHFTDMILEFRNSPKDFLYFLFHNPLKFTAL